MERRDEDYGQLGMNKKSETPIMHQVHWNNWKNYLLNQSQNGQNSKFILNRFVEEEQ